MVSEQSTHSSESSQNNRLPVAAVFRLHRHASTHHLSGPHPHGGHDGVWRNGYQWLWHPALREGLHHLCQCTVWELSFVFVLFFDGFNSFIRKFRGPTIVNYQWRCLGVLSSWSIDNSFRTFPERFQAFGRCFRAACAPFSVRFERNGFAWWFTSTATTQEEERNIGREQ